MVEHMCQICKKILKIHTNFINHTQKRKIPCVPIQQNIVNQKENLPFVAPVLPIVDKDDKDDNNLKNEKKNISK
jgi:hypothetical protein